MTTTGPKANVLDLIQRDHEQVKMLLGRFESVPAGEREQYFCQVVHELVPHEVAEEELIYPALRKNAPNGGKEADLRIAEQSEAEAMLKEMERMDARSEEFRAKFEQLRTAVLGHAMKEETGAWPLLRQALSAEDLVTLGGRYEKAKSGAPTHPHPHAPDTPPGNVVLGPIAAVVDRARDAVRGS